MYPTDVIHLHDSAEDEWFRRDFVYIGRAYRAGRAWKPASKWANPFHIGAHGTREEVIAKYEAYVRADPELIAALPELRGKVLTCWCRPEACHGDVLVRLLEEFHGAGE